MEGFKKVGDDLVRVIEKDDSGSSVSESEEDKHYSNLRERLKHLLHSTKFHIVIISLVIFDCLLVIAELIIDLEMIKLHKKHMVIPEVLHYLSISVLCIFMLEIFLKIFALRLDFFKAKYKMEVFDAIIVIVSLALDIAFAHKEGAEAGFNLLIIVRLWRIPRIVNGVVLSVKTQAERQLTREKNLRAATEQELSKFREYCQAQEKEIEVLRLLLNENNIVYNKTELQFAGSKIDVIAEVNKFSEK